LPDAGNGLFVQGGIAHNAAGADIFAAEFELGFDEADELAVVRMQHGHHGWEDQGQRDEGKIKHRQINRFRNIVRQEMPEIELLAGDDPGVAADLPDQLVGAHIEGIDLGRAVLEQAVGEPAGGGSGIETGQAGRIDLKMRQGSFQFKAPSADIPWFGFDGNGVVRFDGLSGFGGRVAINQHFAGKDETFGLLAGITEAAFREGGIEAETPSAGLGPRTGERVFSHDSKLGDTPS
jgi:hypothetical protein